MMEKKPNLRAVPNGKTKKEFEQKVPEEDILNARNNEFRIKIFEFLKELHEKENFQFEDIMIMTHVHHRDDPDKKRILKFNFYGMTVDNAISLMRDMEYIIMRRLKFPEE